MQTLKLGVVGFGYLGQFHSEKYHQLKDVQLRIICDTDSTRLEEAERLFHVQTTPDYRELFNSVDAVSIVVPTSKHHEIAKEFLRRGIHVLLEKPMTSTVQEADELIQIAQEQNVHLQIGHLERFNPTMRTLIKHSTFAPRHITSQRLSAFNPRGTDVNVVLDLMIHDLDLILQFIKQPIVNIQADGRKILTQEIDLATTWIYFENGSSAHLHANRVSDQKTRRLHFYYDDHFILADLSHKKLEKHPLHIIQAGQNRSEHSTLPVVQEDALYQQLSTFTDAILRRKPVTVNGHEGRQALSIALQITQLIHKNMRQPWEKQVLQAS